MKPRPLVLISLLFSLVLFAREPRSAACAGTLAKAYRYCTLDPKVVYRGNEAEVITLEVATSNESITRVQLTSPDTLRMYDDGTHGDRLAGDGIFTRNKIKNPTNGLPLRYGGTHNIWGIFKVEIGRTDGSVETIWPTLGFVQEKQSFATVELGKGLYATDYAFFIVDQKGEVLDAPVWPLGDIHCGDGNYLAFEKLYSVLPDIFDFVIIMPAHEIYDPARNYGQNVPYYKRARNTIQHIGLDLADNTATFHSHGRLTGMIYHSWDTGQILDHEFGHAWGANLGKSLGLCYVPGSSGNHWSPYSDIGGQMCAFLSHPSVPYGSGQLKDNGDGSWRITRDPEDSTLYSKLDLYAMGLIPSSQVPPVHILVNPDIANKDHVTADTVRTITIADILAAEGGERVPSVKDSPKEFNVAFIVVKNKDFTPAEFAFYSLVSKYFASTEQGDFSLTTFYTATGGRATLNVKLPVAVQVEETRPLVAEFELQPSHPNPFNSSTMIEYRLNAAGTVELMVYNCLGQLARRLLQGRQAAGAHSVEWNGRDDYGRDMPSGLYYALLKAGDQIRMIKLALVR